MSAETKEIEITNGLEVHNTIELLDKADDELILAELAGKVLESCVYEFPMEGKTVQGLSKTGIGECRRELAKRNEILRIKTHGFHVLDDFAYFTVIAYRASMGSNGKEMVLDEALGTKRQWLKMRIWERDGRGKKTGKQLIIPDPNWYEKGYSKCERNAYSKLIPQALKISVIEEAVKQGLLTKLQPKKKLTRTSSARPESPQTSPPPSFSMDPGDTESKREKLKEMLLELSNGDEEVALKKLGRFLAKAGITKDEIAPDFHSLVEKEVNAAFPYVEEEWRQGK